MPSKNQKATSSSPLPSDSAYADFVGSLQLVLLGLKASSTTLDRNKFWEQVSKENGPPRKLIESYEPVTIAKDFFDAEGCYSLTIADGDAIALKIEFTFEVHMHSSVSPIDRRLVERFANTDLRFILLPYARHFVTEATVLMEIPPVILPLATVTGRPRSKKESGTAKVSKEG